MKKEKEKSANIWTEANATNGLGFDGTKNLII